MTPNPNIDRSHRSSTTRSSLRSSIGSEFLGTASIASTPDIIDTDTADYRAVTWNPVASIQTYGSNKFQDELDAIDHESELFTKEDLFLEAASQSSSNKLDPPEVTQAIDTLVPFWDDVVKTTATDGGCSSATDELSSSNPVSEDDVEPCEEHYRVPPAEDKVAEQQIVVRESPSDPPDVVDRSRDELVHKIYSQLALIPDAVPNTITPKCSGGYRHHFITVKEHHRFSLLYNFLKRHVKSKIILYLNSTKSTLFHAKLLTRLQFDAKYIHHGLSKEEFLDTYLSFSKQKYGILCLPDGHGKELTVSSSVSWIVQYDPPNDPAEYIYRIGRIQQHSSETSSQNPPRRRALLFLTPQQFNFLNYFKCAHVKIYEYVIHNLSNVQHRYETLVRKDDKLHSLGVAAYHSYMMKYASHEYKDVYDVHTLNRDRVATSFGFGKAPKVAEKNESKNKKKLSSREANRWKPSKLEGNGEPWMNKEERVWRKANIHSHLMKKEER